MSKKYFSKLNYSLANEDTSLEYHMVNQLKPKRTLSVCGSGGRCLPLLPGTQSELVCADLSSQQLLLANHRKATIEALNHQDFLLYWGFQPFRTDDNRSVRKAIFADLNLDAATREYFTELYEDIHWNGLIYEGKWEKTFTGVPKLLRRIVGKRYDAIFEFKDMTAQKEYFDRELEDARWTLIPRLVLRAFGNAAFFNAFLYKGHFVQKNVAESHFEYYRTAYRKLFYQGLCRENFFLQLSFMGRIQFPEANTIEAHADVLEQMKASLKEKTVTFVNADLISFAGEDRNKFDFVSLSDVPSYFSDHLGKIYLQELSKGLNPGALVVVRSYLRVPENTDLKGFKDVTERYQNLIEKEKTQIYVINVFEFQG